VVESQLPAEVQALGVRVEKVNNNFAMAVGFDAGPYTDQFVNNYIDLYVRDRLKRVKGVSDIVIFGGGKYSMRLGSIRKSWRAAALRRRMSSGL